MLRQKKTPAGGKMKLREARTGSAYPLLYPGTGIPGNPGKSMPANHLPDQGRCPRIREKT